MNAAEGSLDLRSGLVAAATWGLFGAVSVVAVVLAIDAISEWQDLRSVDNHRWLDYLLFAAPSPAIGTAAVLASAAFAARASRPVRGLASSVAIVFAGSLVLWMFLSATECMPRRSKMDEDVLIHPSEFLALVGPPMLIAACLLGSRVGRGARVDD